MSSLAADGCVVIHVTPRDSMQHHLNPVVRRNKVDPIPSSIVTTQNNSSRNKTTSSNSDETDTGGVNHLTSAARNVTNETCRDSSSSSPKETDSSSSGATKTTAPRSTNSVVAADESHKNSLQRIQPASLKRSSRNMTLIGRTEDENNNNSNRPFVNAKNANTSDDCGETNNVASSAAATAASTADSAALPVAAEELSGHPAPEDFEYALTWQRNNRVLLRRLEEAAPRGNLSLINLTRRGIGRNEAGLLQEAIRLNPLLSVLKLSYNDLGDAGTEIIAGAFVQDGKHHEKLSVLDLGFNDVGDIGCEALAIMALAGNQTISSVYLSGNRIRSRGALAIAGAILHGTGLSTLHVTANRIGSKGLKAIASAVAKRDASVMELLQQQQQQQQTQSVADQIVAPRTVTELHVGSTGINSAGFIAIPGMVLSNHSLRALNLSNNGIADQDILMLAQALTQNPNMPLAKLELSFNEISDQGVECLMNAVWGSPHLRVVRLDNNKLQDRGVQLCAVVLTSIALEVLDVGFNRVTTTGIKSLMKNVSECTSLKNLGMSGIAVDQNASKALAYALAYNSSLVSLHLDNCSMGYSAQRHIVAGIISNRRTALRVLTGFPIAQIAMTLGMPRLPEAWSNVQVLGFVRLMWQQWLLKSGHGRVANATDVRGPAPPAAVATAAKIAMSSLGTNKEHMFKAETHDRPLAEGPPVDPAGAALLERSVSGTLNTPSFSDSVSGDLHEWIEEQNNGQSITEDFKSAITVSALEDPVRRNKNLKWLRTHFRSLSEVGRLPFNNADLWQLHQFYFSPPAVDDADDGEENLDESLSGQTGSLSVPQNSPVHTDDKSLGRVLSFSTLGHALAANGLNSSSTDNQHKRTHEDEEPDEPLSKRVKYRKPRIEFYPRIMAKIQSMGTRPMDQSLSLLRQLKYTENVLFGDKNPYEDCSPKDTVHQDIQMILLDLL